MTPFTRYRILGVDLGQTSDPSAACVLEKKIYDGGYIGPPDITVRLADLRKWPLGTDYNRVVDDLLDARAIDVIVCDFTGVGRPVVDLLRKRALERNYRGKIIPVVIAASNTTLRQKTEARGSYWTVPKCDLISALNVLSQSRQLRTGNPRKDPLVKALHEELAAFERKVTKSANETYNAKSGKHDDIVCAVCLAAWWLLRYGSRRLAIYQGGGKSIPTAGWVKQGRFA